MLSLLGCLEMMPDEQKQVEVEGHLFIEERFYISAQNDGIFYSKKTSGEYLSKGMKIGHVANYFGETIEEIYANANGILLIIMNTPPINKGETIAVIGKVD